MPKFIDLTREIYHRTPNYPGQPPIIKGVWKSHEEAFVDSGNVWGNSVHYFSMPDHGGTHLDAPRHFHKDATSIDKYPLENCYVKGICLDLRHMESRSVISSVHLQERFQLLPCYRLVDRSCFTLRSKRSNSLDSVTNS